MSFGVGASSSGPFDYQAVFTAADQALYAAKAAGGNCVRVSLLSAPEAGAGPVSSSILTVRDLSRATDPVGTSS